MFARRASVYAWIALGAGCHAGDDDKGGPADDADADADADSDTDADADSDADADPTDHDWFEPAVVVMSAWFGYDADTASLVDVVSPYGTTEPRIRLEVGDDAWAATDFDGYRVDLYCVIELPLTDPSPASWAQSDPGIWYGLDYTGAPVDSDCAAESGYDVDPDAFVGYADLGEALSLSLPWGVGVGEIGADNPALQDYVAAYPYAVIPAGALAGGYVQDGLLGVLKQEAMVVGHPVDEDGIVDFTSYLSATEMHPGGVGLATGFYRIYFLYSVTL